MIISRLGLRNWRNFRSVDVPLTPRVFIIGPNASGKSNLLDSLRFLRDIAKAGGGLQPALTKRGGLSKVRCLAARREPDVELDVVLASHDGEPAWRYAIGITQQVRGNRLPLLRYERVWRDAEQILNRPDADDKQDELRLTQTHLEQIGANAAFRDVARFLESIRYLHLVPQLLRHPESFQGASSDDDPFGRNFLEAIAKTPEKTRKARLRKIGAALQKAVPQLEDLSDAKDEAGVPHLEARYKHWRPQAGLQREDQFSDGTLRLIGLFWSLLDAESPLLLEEPELSLNAEIVRHLPALFSSIQHKRRRQIFVSTHSGDLLNDKGIGGEEVLVLEPGQEGTAVRLGSDGEARTILESGFSVADALLPRTRPSSLDQLTLF